MRRLSVVILILLLLTTLTAPVFADEKTNGEKAPTQGAAYKSGSNSSLWSNNRDSIPMKKGLKDKDNLKKFVNNQGTYLGRYRIISSAGVMDIDASVPAALSGMFYSFSKTLGEWSVTITYYSQEKAYELLEGADDKYNETIWKGYANYFKTGNSNFMMLVGIVGLIVGLLGVFSLIQGKTSEGLGRVIALVASFMLAVLVYSNGTALLKNGANLSRSLSSALEASLDINSTADKKDASAASTYYMMVDNMIVKPYNYLQYNEYDPLKSKKVMSESMHMYNYFITYTNEDKANAWFGEPIKQAEADEIYGNDKQGITYVSESSHKAVASKLAGEDGLIKDMGSALSELFTSTTNNAYDGLNDLYGDSVFTYADDGDSYVKVNGKIYRLNKIYGSEGWGGKVGASFLMFVMAIIMFVVYLVIAGITVAGQILVLLTMLLGLPILIYSMFKGFGPLSKLVTTFALGFGCVIIAGVARGLFSSMMGIFATVSGDNLVIQLFLTLITLFISTKFATRYLAKATAGESTSMLSRAKMDAMWAARRGGMEAKWVARRAEKNALKSMKNAIHGKDKDDVQNGDPNATPSDGMANPLGGHANANDTNGQNDGKANENAKADNVAEENDETFNTQDNANDKVNEADIDEKEDMNKEDNANSSARETEKEDETEDPLRRRANAGHGDMNDATDASRETNNANANTNEKVKEKPAAENSSIKDNVRENANDNMPDKGKANETESNLKKEDNTEEQPKFNKPSKAEKPEIAKPNDPIKDSKGEPNLNGDTDKVRPNERVKDNVSKEPTERISAGDIKNANNTNDASFKNKETKEASSPEIKDKAASASQKPSAQASSQTSKQKAANKPQTKQTHQSMAKGAANQAAKTSTAASGASVSNTQKVNGKQNVKPQSVKNSQKVTTAQRTPQQQTPQKQQPQQKAVPQQKAPQQSNTQKVVEQRSPVYEDTRQRQKLKKDSIAKTSSAEAPRSVKQTEKMTIGRGSKMAPVEAPTVATKTPKNVGPKGTGIKEPRANVTANTETVKVRQATPKMTGGSVKPKDSNPKG